MKSTRFILFNGRALLWFALPWMPTASHCQFTLEGDASDEGGGCIQLTADDDNEIGAAWSNVPLDLTEPFDIVCTVYLGDSNNGGDGMAWVIRNENSNDLQPNQMPGPDGQYLGYGSIDESLAVEIDTDDNNSANDPNYDHLAVMQDGNPDHDDPTCLFGPVPCLPGNLNVENSQDHTFRVAWNPDTDSLHVYFDCLLRIATVVDIPNIVGAAEGIWGFVACTESEQNQHRFCEAELVDPEEVTLEDLVLCPGEEALVTLPEGLDNLQWSPGSGLSSTASNVVTVAPSMTTTYTVTWLNECGASAFATFTVEVSQLDENLDFPALELCDGAPVGVPPLLLPIGYEVGWGAPDGEWPSEVSVTGDIDIFISDPLGCVWQETLTVGNVILPTLDLGSDITLCPGQSFTWDTGDPATVWGNGSIGAFFTSTETETVTAVIGEPGCFVQDEVEVELVLNYAPTWSNSWMLCGTNGEVELNATDFNWIGETPVYNWNTGESAVSIVVDSPGTYVVEVAVEGCLFTFQSEVEPATINDVELGTDQALCAGEEINWNVGYPNAWVSWFQDGVFVSGGSVFSTDEAGSYEVVVSNQGCEVFDSIQVSAIPPYMPSDLGDLVLCSGASVDLNGVDDSWNSGSVDFSWQGGPNASSWSIDSPGMYTLEVNAGGCMHVFEVQVDASDISGLDLGADLEVCEGEVVLLNTGYPSAWVTWSLENAPAGTGTSWNLDEAGTWQCEVTDGFCTASDEVILAYLPIYEANLPLSLSFCEGEEVTVTAASGADTYNWSNGDVQASAVVDQPGWVTLTASYLGCAFDFSLQAMEVPLPLVDLGPDIGVCEGQNVILTTNNLNFDWVQWNGNQYGDQYTVTETGLVEVEVSAAGCANSDQVWVEFYPMPDFDLGLDLTLCAGNPAILEVEGIPPGTEVTWNPGGSNSTQLVVDESNVYSATASLGGCEYTDEVQVLFSQPYSPDLPEEIQVCLGTTEILTAALADTLFPTWYHWTPGGEGRSVALDHEGSYEFNAGNVCGQWSHVVTVEWEDCDCSIFVPSAFTPNNDGRNDQFKPEMDCEPIRYTFEILNRWGVRFFATNDPSVGWIGEVPDGLDDDHPYFGVQDVYVWQVTAVFEKNGVARHQVHSGQVLLVR